MGETPKLRRRSASLRRLETASVLVNYTPLDSFEAVSEGAAFNGNGRYSSSLLACARAPDIAACKRWPISCLR